MNHEGNKLCLAGASEERKIEIHSGGKGAKETIYVTQGRCLPQKS